MSREDMLKTLADDALAAMDCGNEEQYRHVTRVRLERLIDLLGVPSHPQSDYAINRNRKV
jgi:hypothetical protein